MRRLRPFGPRLCRAASAAARTQAKGPLESSSLGVLETKSFKAGSKTHKPPDSGALAVAHSRGNRKIVAWRPFLLECQPMADLARSAPVRDPYEYRDEDIAVPPRKLTDILKRIGPGMILAASIVGSGELIATTTLGAQVGYVALWVIVLSCIIKPVVQAEMGRYTIASAETGLSAYDRLPGPR